MSWLARALIVVALLCGLGVVAAGQASADGLDASQRAVAAPAKTRAQWLKATARAWRAKPASYRRTVSLAKYRRLHPYRPTVKTKAKGPVGRYVAPTVTLRGVTCAPLDPRGTVFRVTFTWVVSGGVYDLRFLSTESMEARRRFTRPQSVNRNRSFTLTSSADVVAGQPIEVLGIMADFAPFGQAATFVRSHTVRGVTTAPWSACA
jgi:hypothetical protein